MNLEPLIAFSSLQNQKLPQKQERQVQGGQSQNNQLVKTL